MSRLWTLVRAYLDRQQFHVSERALAKKLGYQSSSTFDNWRKPKSLPSADALARFAQLSGTPYQRVLDAALEDIGYLPEPVVDDAPVRRWNTGNQRLELMQEAERENDPKLRALHLEVGEIEPEYLERYYETSELRGQYAALHEVQDLRAQTAAETEGGEGHDRPAPTKDDDDESAGADVIKLNKPAVLDNRAARNTGRATAEQKRAAEKKAEADDPNYWDPS